MSTRKKIAMMLIVILFVQILFPILSVMFQCGITLMSIASEEKKSGNWKYVVNDDGTSITIIEYTGTEEYLIIPSEIDGYTVKAIGGKVSTTSGIGEYGAIYHRNSLKTVKLPNTLKILGSSTFRNCENLYSIEFNDGLEEIGSMAFDGCASLKKIELKDGLKIIGQQAFLDCEALEKIEIPSTVESIVCNWEMNSFRDCNSLTSINVNQNNPNYSSQDGVLFNKEKTILIAYPNAKQDENYSIPQSVNKVYASAFKNPYIKNLSISKNLTKLRGSGESQFFKGNMLSISNCTNLQNIIVDENNQVYSSINGILYNKGQTELLFYPSGKNDKYYIMPETVNKVPNFETSTETVNNQYIEKIKLGSLINDAEFLLNMMNLMYIEVNNANAQYIQKNGVLYNKNGNRVVYYPMGKEDESYAIDNNVTEIAAKAFLNSKLTEIKLSDNTAVIEKEAFYNSTRLENITIPNDVVTIGESAFYNCINIKQLIFEDNSKLETVGVDAFSNCLSLKEISIPDNVTDIDERFDNCSNLRYISIPNNCDSLELYSFSCLASTNLPQIITINNENPTMPSGWIFENPDMGDTVIRCYKTATNVINWTKKYGDFYYNIIDLVEGDERFLYEIIDDNQVKITDYIGDEENVEIPDQIQGIPVTSIARCIGTYKNLTIPSTVKNIGEIYSSNLEHITVDDENQYFTSKDGILFNKNESQLLCYPMGKKETSYNIPEGTTLIGGTTSVVVGNIRYEPTGFNGNMHLESLNIPKSISEIKMSTLNMVNLSEFSIDPENSKYVVKDKILYKVNGNSIEIEEVPTNIDGDIELLYGLNKIDTYEFEKLVNIKSVVVPTTVTNISHNAFYLCANLEKLVIPPTVTQLAEVNAGNTCFGNVGCKEFKVYCEEESIVPQYAEKWAVDYQIIKPIKIEIKQKPSKLSYLKDVETLNLEGGLITITYDDGTSLDLDMTSNLINSSGFNNMIVGTKTIEVEYNGCKTSFYVNIVEDLETLAGIAVTKAPTYTSYIEGQNFDPTGMIVTATYNDGTTKQVTDYTVTDGNNLTTGKTSVTISYTEGEITKTTTQSITVTEKLEIDLGTYEEKQGETGKYITKIAPETKLEKVIENIDTNGTIEIYKGTQKITDLETNIGTGMTVRITFNNQKAEYTIVVKGDINGDGSAKLSDLSKLKLSIVGTTQLEGAYREAADLNGDGNVKLSDLSKMKLYLVGKGSI